MPTSDVSLKRPSRATSYDVAMAAGVSQSTVSRCFQADSPISEDTRARVLAMADQLGYRPNALARSLILRRSNVVGVIVTRYTLRYNPDLLYTLGETLAAQGAKVLLITVDDDAAVHTTLRNVLEFPLDGLISCASMRDADIEELHRHGVPVVFFNRHVSAPGVDCVSTDNAAAAGTMAQGLFDAGHQRFLCIAGPVGAPVSDARIGGFVERANALGTQRIDVVHADFSYEQGSAVFLAWMSANAHRQIDAVFCANDQIALGVLDACRFTLGLQIPHRMSVVGFDDIAEAARPAYRLTTVRQQVDVLAAQAVRLLASRLADPDQPARFINVAGVLVERASARFGGGR